MWVGWDLPFYCIFVQIDKVISDLWKWGSLFSPHVSVEVSIKSRPPVSYKLEYDNIGLT